MTESKIAHPYTSHQAHDNGADASDHNASVDRHPRDLKSGDSHKANGWDTYKRWLTRVQAPGNSRVPLDANLYTWKGYRSWSDKVRRDWKPED
ncbi:MAG: hypothetical protein ACR2QB_04705 [Gammaproteobacteria bacterium]